MYQLDADYDVAIVGGGVAGQSAALLLGRSHITCCVIDDADATLYRGESHNWLTNDGETKSRILEKGAAELDHYPAVARRSGRVTSIEKDAFGYTLRLADGDEIVATRLVFAPGLGYTPDPLGIPGFDARFGQDIFTCPYCHGYEVSDRSLALIGATERDGDFLKLLSNWSAQLDYVSHDGPDAASAASRLAQVSTGRAVTGRIARMEGPAGAPVAIMEDGQEIAADAFFVADLPSDNAWPLIDLLGVERGLHPMTGKPIYKTDQTGRTDLGDVFIIGDARTGFSTLSGAANEGMVAGVMLTNDIIDARTKADTATAAAI